ncbi:MAG: DMT family protein [Tidjanibacter sp.]|nr:DMT family protein [Tidjanibacter sp.]MBQ5931401.1 DMT family protein [Tidjanibacter sp.]
MKGITTIVMLLLSNVFMTFAWYGNLKLKEMNGGKDPFPLIIIILLSWGIAFFEYCLTIPANRIGFLGNGGPFSLFQLKIIQECISLVVFTLLALFLFKTETFRWNYLVSFGLILAAVYFAFKK